MSPSLLGRPKEPSEGRHYDASRHLLHERTNTPPRDVFAGKRANFAAFRLFSHRVGQSKSLLSLGM